MDKQGLQTLFAKWRRRFDRTPPSALLIYGRRAAPAAGFSLPELAEAGLDPERARALGMNVDPARMSSLGANVENLKRFLER